MKFTIEKPFKKIFEDQLVDFEKYLGKDLPKDYRDFLLKYNGGRPNLDIFKIEKEEFESDINCFYGLIEGNTHNDIKHSHAILESRLPKNALAIGTDSGGNQIFLDLNTHYIYFFDHETEESFFISKDFSSFLDSLYRIEIEKSPLDEAVESEDIPFFESMIKSGCHVDDILNRFDDRIFLIACGHGKLKLVKYFLEQGSCIDEGLFRAIFGGRLKVVEYLLEKGASPNERRSFNNDTALMDASALGHLEIAKLLISKGADIHAVNDYEQTALIKARRSSNKELVEYYENEIYK